MVRSSLDMLMRKTISLFVVLFFTSCLFAHNPSSVTGPSLVYPEGVSHKEEDPEIKNLVWHRWTTKNFTILSINYQQGKWLADNLEEVKSWCLARWGFPDFDFSKECRIFCVDDPKLLKKLFDVDSSKVEVRRNDGKVELSAIWMLLNGQPASTVPIPLSRVCWAEFEQKYGASLGWWAYRGMSLLNGTLPQIKSNFLNLNNVIQADLPVYLSRNLFTMTEDQYNMNSKKNQEIFDLQSMALCLMLRKEFGEAKMQGFLRISAKNETENVLKLVYGFTGYDQFDISFVRYMRDLSRDIKESKTPDDYLNIQPVE